MKTKNGKQPKGSALARRIATAILTVYSSDGATECTRAQMMLEQPDGTERNMGGRDKSSLVMEIDRLLTHHARNEKTHGRPGLNP